MENRHSIQVMIPSQNIQDRIKEIAHEVNETFKGQPLLVVGVLNGAFMFAADLIRQLSGPITIHFMKATSYSGETSTGSLHLNWVNKPQFFEKNVLIVEDIVDTGLTLDGILKVIQKESPAQIKVCALLDKPTRRKTPVNADFVCFTIPDEFVVGYGLDYDEKYRHLPFVAKLGKS